MSNKHKISIEVLKTFEPISSLSIERLEELIGLVDIEVLGVGVTIFREGDVDNQSVYLIDGDVQMTSVSSQNLNNSMSHKSNDAKHPLAAGQPRQVTCTAMTLTKVLRVDNGILDYMLTWDQLAVAEEVEIKEEPAIDETQVIKTESAAVSAENNLTVDNLTAYVANKSAPGSENSKQDKQKADEAVVDNSKTIKSKRNSPDEDGRNWIRRMRHIMAFKSMPPAHIKSLLQRMETVSVEENEVII
jgi:hypothetical protein